MLSTRTRRRPGCGLRGPSATDIGQDPVWRITKALGIIAEIEAATR